MDAEGVDCWGNEIDAGSVSDFVGSTGPNVRRRRTECRFSHVQPRAARDVARMVGHGVAKGPFAALMTDADSGLWAAQHARGRHGEWLEAGCSRPAPKGARQPSPSHGWPSAHLADPCVFPRCHAATRRRRTLDAALGRIRHGAAGRWCDPAYACQRTERTVAVVLAAMDAMDAMDGSLGLSTHCLPSRCLAWHVRAIGRQRDALTVRGGSTRPPWIPALPGLAASPSLPGWAACRMDREYAEDPYRPKRIHTRYREREAERRCSSVLWHCTMRFL